MPVDKFGHFVFSFNRKKNFACPDFGIRLDDDQHINFQSKRLKNVADPIDERDGLNQRHLKEALDKRSKNILEEIEKLRKELINTKASLEDILANEINFLSSRVDGVAETIFQLIENKIKRKIK